jgi:putative ABC transport system ATP-binding protein
LLNIIATFDRPDAGQVWLAGKLLHRLAPREAETVRQRDIGFVFQDFGLLASLTARENVEMALIASRLSRSRRKVLAREALVSVGIDELADRFPHEMSAGQKQRVGIARAIVKRPKLVIADEPTANLDAESAFALVTRIRELARDSQTAFLIATHDQRLVEAASKRFSLSNGRLYKVGAA